MFDGAAVYVDIGPKYGTAEGVRSNRKVAVLIDQYDDDWSQLKGVLLKCTAEAVKAEQQRAAWAMIREKFPQYSSVGWEPHLTLALLPYEWRQWGITGP